MKSIIDKVQQFSDEQWQSMIGNVEKAIPSKAQHSSVAVVLHWASVAAEQPILMIGQQVHVWNGKYYSLGDIYDIIHAACVRLNLPIALAVDPDFIKNVERSLSVACARNQRKADLAPRGINFQDGWLRITQTECEFVQGHDVRNAFTYCLPFNYNGSRKKSKVWRPFIEQIVPNEILREYILCSFANAVACDPMRAQRMMLLMGVGASGKSTLIDAVARTIQDPDNSEQKNTCRVDDLRNLTKDESRFRIDLAKNILCICGDASGDIGNKDVLKQIISKEEIGGRRLYREVEYFVPRASLIVASNEIGFTYALGDSGISRRIDIIQFNDPVAEKDRDPHIGEKLASPDEQREMVLDMIGSLIKMQNEHGKMVRPAILDAALNEFRFDGDVVLGFLGSSGLRLASGSEKGSDAVEWIHQDKVWSIFKEFARDNGYKEGSLRNLKGKFASHGAIKEGAGQRKHKFGFIIEDQQAYDKASMFTNTQLQFK